MYVNDRKLTVSSYLLNTNNYILAKAYQLADQWLYIARLFLDKNKYKYKYKYSIKRNNKKACFVLFCFVYKFKFKFNSSII